MNAYDRWATPVMIVAMAIWCIAIAVRTQSNREAIESVMASQSDEMSVVTDAIERLTESNEYMMRTDGTLLKRMSLCEYRLETSYESDVKIIGIVDILAATQERVMTDLGYE